MKLPLVSWTKLTEMCASLSEDKFTLLCPCAAFCLSFQGNASPLPPWIMPMASVASGHVRSQGWVHFCQPWLFLQNGPHTSSWKWKLFGTLWMEICLTGRMKMIWCLKHQKLATVHIGILQNPQYHLMALADLCRWKLIVHINSQWKCKILLFF